MVAEKESAAIVLSDRRRSRASRGETQTASRSLRVLEAVAFRVPRPVRQPSADAEAGAVRRHHVTSTQISGIM
ncbi:hypothetical protein ACKI1J_22850 [Streptomyces scabiei]|uniref:hypothetical protein n=1 Tax=Streptomyces scabiei TaxID=1930 RepID=UPI0038F68D67